jgi:hypothetical protein
MKMVKRNYNNRRRINNPKKVAEDLFEGDYDNREILYWGDTEEFIEENYGDVYRNTTKDWD